jgi:ASC-1-like (ASCH) protein
MADLHLNLKGEYFDQIKAGTKTHEFRLCEKWAKRLKGKVFDRIFIKRGYPKSTDVDRILERPWRGYEQIQITHSHFGSEPVEVFAIQVN